MDFYTATINKNNNIKDFSINTNPLGLPKNIFQNIKEMINMNEFYPDLNCENLRTALSDKYQLDVSHILCGNGASDLIYRLIGALKPRESLIVVPTYEEYEKVLVKNDCKISYYHLMANKNFDYNLLEILDMIQPTLDILILCNPNNPTGTYFSLTDLEQIIHKCQHEQIFVVIDESFIEFLPDWKDNTGKQLITKYSNLIIIDGFTKFYALAGFRIGFAMSSNYKLLNDMFHEGPEYNVSTISQIASALSLEDKEYLKNTYELLHSESNFLRQELQQFPIQIVTITSNFILIYSEKDQLRELLLNYKIKIRDCSKFIGLDNYYHRISIRKHNDNLELITVLKEIFK